MSVKDLGSEFVSLKKEFTDIKIKIDNLLEKYGNLERKYEKCLSKQKNFFLNVGSVVKNVKILKL